jgi:hypothetical protein
MDLDENRHFFVQMYGKNNGFGQKTSVKTYSSKPLTTEETLLADEIVTFSFS